MAALTPCPSPLAKSAPGEGRALNFPLGIVKNSPLSRSAFCEGRGAGGEGLTPQRN